MRIIKTCASVQCHVFVKGTKQQLFNIEKAAIIIYIAQWASMEKLWGIVCDLIIPPEYPGIGLRIL